MSPEAFLLRVVHFILTLYSAVHCFWDIFRKKVVSLSSKYTESIPSDANKSLTKLPIHIGFVVVEDELSYSDLAKIAIWCIVLGISNISIYDRQGKCKKNKDEFLEEFHKHKKRLSPNSSLDSTHTQVHIGSGGPTREITSRNQFHIHLLSTDDGRGNLIKTTREISRAVKQFSMKLSDIETTSVDSMLIDQANFPDPDLVVRFGLTESLFGFLPWQIRLTEFLTLPSHRHLDFKSFHKLLISYCHTQQRFGK